MDDEMKTLLNKIKTEQKEKNKSFAKVKELQIELVKIKYANDSEKLQSEMKNLNEIHFFRKKDYLRLNRKY